MFNFDPNPYLFFIVLQLVEFIQIKPIIDFQSGLDGTYEVELKTRAGLKEKQQIFASHPMFVHAKVAYTKFRIHKVLWLGCFTV